MSFLALLILLASASYAVRRCLAWPADHRWAMRIGTGCAFIYTGVDHFVSASTRYLPMMPEYFGSWSLPLVYFTGVAEVAGGAALLLPKAWIRKLEPPSLHRWAGAGLIVLLACVVIANVNVAVKGGSVQGFGFGNWYVLSRPFFQPLIMWWVAYAVGLTLTPSDQKELS